MSNHEDGTWGIEAVRSLGDEEDDELLLQLDDFDFPTNEKRVA